MGGVGVYFSLLVFGHSLHFPITYNKHLPLEQHKILLVSSGFFMFGVVLGVSTSPSTGSLVRGNRSIRGSHIVSHNFSPFLM